MLCATTMLKRIQVWLFASIKPPKNHKEGPIPDLAFDSLSNRPNVCPVVATIEYMSRTREFREAVDGLKRTKLLLSLDSRHCDVKAGTISRWIQMGMDLSGFDTSLFKAHSIRGASVSSLASKGMTLRES